MFQNNFKLAFRHLLKNKMFTAIKLIGLTVGITACLLVGLYLHNELTYDSCHEKADRIVKVNMEYHFGGETVNTNVTGNKVAPSFVRDFPEVQSAVRVIEFKQVVKYGSLLLEEAHFYFADSTFFKIFNFPLLKGNPERALNGPDQVVLTASTAKRYFGDEEPVGKVLNVGTKEVIVTGIMADPPLNTHLKPDFVGSFMSLPQARPENETWWNANYTTYLLLKQPAGMESMQPKIRDYMASKATETGIEGENYVTFHLQKLPDLHLHSTVAGNFEPNGDIRYLYILSVVAFLILLIACTTYVNLTTAASTERAREVGVQKVLGANRSQLTGQHLGESAIVTFGALVLGFALVAPLLPVFNRLFDRQLVIGPLFSPAALSGLVVFGFVVSLLAGFYPAMVVSKFQPVKVLKGHFKFTASGVWLRKSLVVLQFGISILLIICTLLLQEQMHFIQNKKLGFDKEQVLTLPTDGQVIKAYDALKSQLLQNANIQSVAMSYDSPVQIKGGYSVSKTADDSDGLPVTAQPAGLDFLKTAGIELAAGSDLTAADIENYDKSRSDSTVEISVLLNESQAKVFGWTPEEAINQFIVFNGTRSLVKGVVKDFNFASLHDPIGPLVIFPSSYGRFILVKMAGQDLEATLSYMGKQWEALVPHRPFSYQFLDDEFDRMYTAEIQTSKVVTTFTWLAILLACLGLFGLASYSFVQRTKEIGIRKVLGASVSGIVGLLSREFLALVIVSLAIASPLAYFGMKKWLQDFAYRIDIHWSVFALAGLLAVAVAFLTVGFQSVKAALADPVKSLRSE